MTNPRKQLDLLRDQGIEVVEVGEENQLFLDDEYLVSETSGIRYVACTAEAFEGNPVLSPDRPWEPSYAYVTALGDEEDGLFKIWYWIHGEGGRPMTGYAVSSDGLKWEKPSLGVVEFQGSKENNICFLSGPPERRSQTNHVFKDYSDPDPAKRYKMVLDHVDHEGRGITFAFSPDGISWRQMHHNVLHGGFDTQNVVIWDDRVGAFRAYLRWWLYGMRHVRMAESRDLYHWSKPVLVHGPDEEDPDDLDVYTPATAKYPEAPNVYVMMNSVYDHASGKVWAQLSLSRDGISWHRHREPFMPCGKEGEWDSGMIFVAPALIVRDDRIFIYYRGEDRLHGPIQGPYRTGIGCATLRRDGFIGLEAGPEGGVIVTRPIAFSRGGGKMPTRGRLFVNLDAGSGEARVEICDLKLQPHAGFGREDCDPITEDSIRAKVTWRGNPVLDEFLCKPIVIRFHMRDATLYSMRFARTGEDSDPLERELHGLEAKYRESPLGEARERAMEEIVRRVRELREG